jgi:hypothetical protein
MLIGHCIQNTRIDFSDSVSVYYQPKVHRDHILLLLLQFTIVLQRIILLEERENLQKRQRALVAAAQHRWRRHSVFLWRSVAEGGVVRPSDETTDSNQVWPPVSIPSDNCDPFCVRLASGASAFHRRRLFSLLSRFPRATARAQGPRTPRFRPPNDGHRTSQGWTSRVPIDFSLAIFRPGPFRGASISGRRRDIIFRKTMNPNRKISGQ